MAGAILVAGFVVAALLVVGFVRNLAGVTRFTAGQPVELDLSAGAQFTVYTGAVSTGGSLAPAPTCDVVDVSNGQPVATAPAGPLTLTLNDDVYRSLAHFKIERDGRYRVSCSSRSGEPVPMVVGPRIRIGRSVGRILAAGAIGLSALGAAAAIIAVTAVKRYQARRSQRPVTMR